MSRLLERNHRASPDDWSVTDCIRIMWRRRAPLLWITFLGVLLGALTTWAQSRVYQSRALVEIQTFNENFLGLRNIYPAVASKVDAGLYVQTQTELLQQDSLIKEVAQKLHLAERPEFQPPSSLLAKLRDDIMIVPLRNTRIIQIICDAREASLSADLANTLARAFIEQSIETRQRAARQTYESLQPQLEGLRQRLPQTAAPRSIHSGLRRARDLFTREAGVNFHVYKSMLQQANDARAASIVRQSNIELIAPAEPPARPHKPNLPLNLAIGTLTGLVLAVGFVMLHEQNTPVLRAPGEAKTILALTELGAIPSADAQKRPTPRLLAPGGEKVRVDRAVLEHQSSRLSESFRCTLTSILSVNGDHPRILIVTSSGPMEGKTTAVSNLGFALAEIGRKTLLIDGDARNPQLLRIFGQPKGHGLSDSLDKTDTIDLPLHELVERTTVPHLFVLACGAQAGNIFGLRHSDRMSLMFRRLREQFDYVLIDTPCLKSSGAKNLARNSDGLILVVRANYTARRAVRGAVERFEDDGFRVMGIILNRWDPPSRDRSLAKLYAAREADWKSGV
jgi:polysaccharide biosynthesis transport protein